MTPDELRAAIMVCDQTMRRLFDERGDDPAIRSSVLCWIDEHASAARSIYDPETRSAWLCYFDAWRKRWDDDSGNDRSVSL
jgi:hypothetical protein